MILAAACACALTAAAAPITCLPSPVGAGSRALFKSNTKGDFVAFYCPGESYPSMVVCLKSTCNLVASRRAFASILSAPTLDGLNKAIARYTRDPLGDPELIQVWLPHADEIRALQP